MSWEALEHYRLLMAVCIISNVNSCKISTANSFKYTYLLFTNLNLYVLHPAMIMEFFNSRNVACLTSHKSFHP